MKIEVLFHGILSDWAGTPRAEIHLPDGGTLADLLSEIKKAYGPNMPPQLWSKDQEAFFRAVWAMRGNERLADLTTKLKGGEEIKFYLSLAGG